MEPAYNPAAWSTFFSAQTGASAALTGLIFVAVSINLAKIVAYPHLISRSAKALATLTGILIASTLCLAPVKSVTTLGIELICLGVLIWLLATISQRGASRHNRHATSAKKAFDVLLGQIAVIPLIVSGVSLIFHRGGGLTWLEAAVVLSFVAALLDAW